MTKEKIHEAARSAYYKFERRREARKTELWEQVNQLKLKIEAQLAEEFGKEGRQLTELVNKSRTDMEAERIEASSKGNDHYKVGQTLWRWEHRNWPVNEWRDTGKRGIVEVFTRDSVMPLGTSQYSKPSIGAIVLRLLKKDGTPSSRIETTTWGGTFHGWLPEGTLPKSANPKKAPHA